jgi:hypothetical protein
MTTQVLAGVAAHIAWSIWLLALGIGLLAGLKRARPAWRRPAGGRLALAYLDCYAAGMDRLWQGGRP